MRERQSRLLGQRAFCRYKLGFLYLEMAMRILSGDIEFTFS